MSDIRLTMRTSVIRAIKRMNDARMIFARSASDRSIEIPSQFSMRFDTSIKLKSGSRR